MTNLKDLKSVRFAEQGGKCAYCDQPMWLNDLPGFARKYQRPERSLRWLQATAEHLQPRGEGGGDTLRNIVAACLYCNTHRHRTRCVLSPELYREKVRKRLAARQWHKLSLAGPQATKRRRARAEF